jgi:hypothetical protein
MGIIRGAGVVGSAAATAGSLVNVLSQGPPRDAFAKNGINYVADIAEVGFNASMTVFMLAPTPVTAALALGTGLIYGVTEVVAHWDDIKRVGSATAKKVGQAIDGAKAAARAAKDDAKKAAGNAKKAAQNAVNNGVEKAKKIGSWLNPFD